MRFIEPREPTLLRDHSLKAISSRLWISLGEGNGVGKVRFMAARPLIVVLYLLASKTLVLLTNYNVISTKHFYLLILRSSH